MTKETLISLTLLIAVSSLFSNAYSESLKPNILVLIADDAGWRDFGCYGNAGVKTPNIDRLADNGLSFTNAFLTTAQCSPSRISILSGKYPHATGAEDLHTPLPADQLLLPHFLKSAGYLSGNIRKAHLGPNGDRQFDWYSWWLSDFPAFLDSCGTQPFFMWVGFDDPHRPYRPGAIVRSHDPAQVTVPPFFADTPETRADLVNYYDEITRMDTGIDSLISELTRRRMMENTLIIFFSDNGAPFPREKGTVYDAGIKTPLIFAWPKGIKPGGKYEGLVSLVDLAPTLLEIAGVQRPEQMHGSSIAGLLTDQSLPGREYVFSERNWHNCDEHIRSVRTNRLKLIENAYTERPLGSPSDITASPTWQALYKLKQEGRLTKSQRLLFDVPRPRIELYDVEADPWELNNLASDPRYDDTVMELFSVLEEWKRETGDFPSDQRRKDDNTDRITGVKFTNEIKKVSGK
jgi:arylsulfatase A-like enzyme